MFPLIKATHYIGLAALLGGPAFWYLIWRPARNTIGEASVLPSDTTFAFTVRASMIIGFVLFTTSGILDIMRAASDLFGFLVWDDFLYFAGESPMGQVILARIGFALLLLTVGLRLHTRPKSLGWIAPLITSLAVIGSVSILSHQAGKDSPFPLIFDMIHLLATALWGGGLIYFALLPWRTMRQEASGTKRLAAIASLFSILGLLSVSVLTITGIYISLQQFYSVAALTGTTYGMYLIRKLAVFLAILGIAGVHHFYFVPGLSDPSEETAQRLGSRFLTVVRIEAVLLLGVLLAVGFLTTQMPPERPVGLVDIADMSGTFGDNRYHLSVLPRDNGQLLFELLVEDPDGRPVELERAELDLTMLEHYMPPYILRMDLAQPGVYRATGILSMGGRWSVTVDLMWGGGQTDQFPIEFDTRAGALRDTQNEKAYSWSAITEKGGGIFWLILFTGLTGAGGYALIKGLRPPRSQLLWIFGMLLFLGGAFQVARVAEVPGPYTYRFNRVRRTKDVIARGADLYQANCMLCHGIEGRGDGPAASSLNPLPANFTGTHVRQHSDGELFWWITKGIPGSSMPPFETILTESERWILVHYIRNLSGVPY